MKLKFIKRKNNYIYFKQGKQKRKILIENFPADIHKGEYFNLEEDGSIQILKEVTLNEIYNKRKLRLKVTIISLVMVALMALIICFAIPSDLYIVNKNNYKNMSYMSKGEEFLSERSDISNRLNTKLIKDFDLRKYTFNFKNITSDISPEGNCFGIAYMEKMNYLDKLPKSKTDEGALLGYDFTNISKEIGNYSMNEDSLNKIYGTNNSNLVDSRDKFNGLFFEDYKPKDLELQELYTLLFNKPQISYDNINQEDMKEILRGITYYQFKQKTIKPKTEYLPYIALGRSSAIYNKFYYYGKRIKSILGIDKYAIGKEININDFINPLDNGEPLVVSVFNSYGGHAVLAYGYEVIGEDYLKIYVKDNNIPLFSNKNEFNRINFEIKNNCYILLKKIDNKWYFKYDPFINEKYIYEHKYNSFMPDSYMKIY